MMEKLISHVEKFSPCCEQEAADKSILLDMLRGGQDITTRENKTAHLTASAWVVNAARDRVLMVYHNIYDSWSWLGGHADGETELWKTALREVREESGVNNARLLSEDIFSLEILTVDGHEKRGEYVPSHLHLNMTYLIEADDTQATHSKPDENSAVAWFSLEGAVEASTEPWFKTRVYPKLNKKLAEFLRTEE